MHRIGGDHRSDQVEHLQQGPQRGDLVALLLDLHLPQHDPGRVVQGRDQMRGDLACGLRAADRLAVDRDHPPPAQQTDPGAHPRPHDSIEHLGVDPGQRPTDRGLARTTRTGDPQSGQHTGVRVGDPLTDRGERTGTGQDRGQRHGQQRREPVPHPTTGPRIAHLPEQLKQRRTNQPRGLDGHGDDRRG